MLVIAGDCARAIAEAHTNRAAQRNINLNSMMFLRFLGTPVAPRDYCTLLPSILVIRNRNSYKYGCGPIRQEKNSILGPANGKKLPPIRPSGPVNLKPRRAESNGRRHQPDRKDGGAVRKSPRSPSPEDSLG